MTIRPVFTLTSFFFLCIILNSCSPEKNAAEFSEPQVLAADSVAVFQIIRPQAFFAGEDRVAVQTLEDTVFYVYSLPDFQLCYTFGRRGEGPGEFSSFSAEQTGSAGVFAVRTHRPAGPMVELYDFSGESAKPTGTFRDRGYDPNFRMAYAVKDDSLLVGAFIRNTPGKEHVLRLVSLATGEIKDSLTDFYQYTIPYGGREHITRNAAHISACGDRVAIAYEESGTLAIYEIGDGKFRSVAPAAGKGPSRDQFDPNPRNSSLTYIAVFSDRDYIYAVNARTDMQTLEQERTMDIVLEVFDWAGKKVKAFRFDKTNRMPVFVDRPRKIVYAIALGENFDRIYMYKMDL